MRGSPQEPPLVSPFGLLLFISVISAACAPSAPDSRLQPAPNTDKLAPSSPDVLNLKEPTELWEYDPPLATAWRHFTSEGRYRFPVPEDFRFSEAAVNALRGGLSAWTKYVTEPYDNWCPGFVALVVDTTRADQNRFGLVIFPVEYKGKERHIAKPYWLVRNKDLSAASLSRASCHHWLYLYDRNGAQEGHYLLFNKKTGKYYFPDI